MTVLQTGNVTPGHVASWTTDGVVFDSASDAAAEHGITACQVSYSCKRYPNRKPRKIPAFRYADG